jgi:hypothetical protein
MPETFKQKCERLRAALFQLFQDAGYENHELLDVLNAYEKLGIENERLKQEAKKRGLAQRAKSSGSMSSKLREALRE